MTVEVAEDSDAYLGLEPGDSPNGDNYAEQDANGHLEVDIGENPNDGYGVNSNSVTWFDNVIKVTNQGKADADFYVEDNGGLGDSEGEIDFYTGAASGNEGDDGIVSILGEGNSVQIELGEYEEIGIRVNSAEDQKAPLFDDHVTLVADSPDAGMEENGDEENGDEA